MNVEDYIKKISKRYESGVSTEHSYRADLQYLLESILDGVQITNEPKRISCGAPDYILTRKKIPVGYIEAKDIGKKLDDKSFDEQFTRYKNTLTNLIITDYIDFWIYRDGKKVASISIGEIKNKKIIPKSQNFYNFIDYIDDFAGFHGQTITSPSKLAKMMADKSRLMASILGNALEEDIKNENKTELVEQFSAFKAVLMHDIEPRYFADIYAQTIAYGLFAARLHDKTLEDFSRQEAAELIPKSNPFLRKLFQNIAGPDLDERIDWIVDALADVFRATDLSKLLKEFGQDTQRNDPFLHFYETFLSEYDPEERKSRGVWYTPEPVVDFIVRSVDELLIDKFGLDDGLANSSKTTVNIETYKKDKRFSDGIKKDKKEVHKVQILDPAAGTGTFLASVIKKIHSKLSSQKGIWSQYVEEELIPRLNGFEILMASYAMAHLKLELYLEETGYKAKSNKRLNVFLTNSLEEYHKDTGTLFSQWLSSEANSANIIKKESPVMVVIGNPPYSISSTNKGEWILNLLNDYKIGLNERKINIDDDYIKFIRYGQYFIDRNKEGILAYISNNSFLDGVTHRQMRKSLLDSFDDIYVVNLHGDTKKKETIDGSKDENVFDIQQGVSINVFVKYKNSSNKSANLYYTEKRCDRTAKYSWLWENSISCVDMEKLSPAEPYYFFVPKDFEFISGYEEGFSLPELYPQYSSGMQTKRDKVCVQFDEPSMKKVVDDFKEMGVEEIREYYGLPADGRDWTIKGAKEDLQNNKAVIVDFLYRPFDIRKTVFTGNSKGFIAYPRNAIMKNFLTDNIGLIVNRQHVGDYFSYVFVTKNINCHGTLYLGNRGQDYLCPLYIYPDENTRADYINTNGRVPNLNNEIIDRISSKLNIEFSPEKINSSDNFSPIDIQDYIYAILHTPSYRNKYKDLLKIDFPRIPYPKNNETFWKLVRLGKRLRMTHLLEDEEVNNFVTSYPSDGNNEVTRKIVKRDWELYDKENNIGRIWINDAQYFDGIPLSAWEMQIGGYQPAQKWLKSRKGLILSYTDIVHYQRIISALLVTDKIMTELDSM